MGFECILVLALLAAVDAATIHLRPIDVPVKVVYGEEDYSVHNAEILGIRNVNEKIQLSPEEIAQLSQGEPNKLQSNPNSVRNLDAKVQLSHQDLLQAEKHLPLPNLKIEINETENLIENSNSNDIGVVTSEEYISSTELSKPDTTVIEDQTAIPSSTTIVSSTPEEDRQDPNFVLLIQIAQTIVWSGLDSIREAIDSLTANEESDKNPSISAEQWDKLNQTISEMFAALLERGSGNENVWFIIVEGVQSRTGNFINHLRTLPETNVDQNVIGVISAGFQRITKNLNSMYSQSDSENTATTSSETLMNKVQELLRASPPLNPDESQQVNKIEQNGNNTIPYEVLNPSSKAPADEPTTSNPLQSIANQVGQAISNLNPFNQLSTAAPGSQGDAPPNNNPFSSFQQVASQVGQAINNLNPFNQPSTAAPGLQGDDPTTSNPFQAFQQAANQVGQAINNLNPFNRPSTAAPGSQGDDPTTNNPLQAFQQAANQVGQAISNLNPFNRPSTAAPGSEADAPTTSRPFQPIQQVASQVGQAINNLNPFNRPSTAAPGSQGDAPSSSNPIQETANQIGQAINNLNPFRPGATPSSATPGEGSTNAPLQGVQNIVGQVGQGLNPLNQGSSSANPLEGAQNAINQAGQTISSSNPLQGAQNAISQAGQSASNLNPLNQGSSGSPAGGVQNEESQPANLLNEGSSTPAAAVGSPLQTIHIISGNPPGAVLEGIQEASSKGDNEGQGATTEGKADEEIMVAMD